MKSVRILSAVILCAGLWCIGQASAYWQSRDSNYNISASVGTPATAAYEIGDVASCVNPVCTSALTLPNGPNSGDVIAVGTCSRSGVSVSTMTYNLATMTQVAGAASGGGMPCDIWYITGVTGTTASVVTTWSANPTHAFAQVYRIVTTTTAVNAGASNVASASSVSQSITVPTNGIGIAFGGYQVPTTPAFSNATLDNTQTSGNAMTAGRVTGTGSVSVTASGNTSPDGISISLAAWAK